MKLTYNNINLDDTLENYITVNVEGRGLFAPQIKTLDIEGRDGDFIESQKYPSRDIKVYFIIRAKQNQEKLEALEKLNLLLQSEEDVEFSFDDERGYRLGRLKAVENIKYNYFTGQGSFTLYCKTPWKYLENKTLEGQTAIIQYEDNHLRLEYVEIILTNTADEVEVKNITNGEKIKVVNLQGLRGNFVINKNRITINNIVITDKLDYTTSTWKNFQIKTGDEIVVLGADNIKITYRGVIL